MTRKKDLPPVPDGYVRVIDDADLCAITITENGFELDLDVHEHHLEEEYVNE